MALLRDTVTAGVVHADTRSHAERLPREAMDWLATQGVTLAEVDAFVVVIGPGSFTGLRVGIAAAQGWAVALGKPLTAVPTLDAMVRSLGGVAPADAIVVPCVDGQRGEVFFGGFLGADTLVPAAVAKPADVLATITVVAAGRPVVIAGDGATRYAAEWQAAGWTIVMPALTLAEGAVHLAAAGRAVAGPPHAARPLYVRKTDAEINRERGGRTPA
jgi:tRNA threonylcarbamoyladenosine biosynthesis protein TsaB